MSDPEFKQTECSVCGCRYCLSVNFHKNRQEDHKAFFCPNGHGQHYPAKEQSGEAENSELQEEKARHQRTLERLNEVTAESEKRGKWPFRLLPGKHK